MLIEHTLFGVVDKVNDAIFLLKKYEPADGYWVCFSGGKDSIVILDLVKRAGVKFEVHYSYMTIEPPELLEFIVTEHPEVIIDYPKTTMFDLIVYHRIPPLRQARYCCHSLKLVHGNNRIKVTGVRRFESHSRAHRQAVELTRTHGDQLINPIIDWTDKDVWEYIHTFKLPYCRLYDEGRKRIGCVFCPMECASDVADDLKRYPQFRDYYIKALQTIIDNRIKNGEKLRRYDNGVDWFYNWIDRSYNWKSKLYATNGDSLFPPNI